MAREAGDRGRGRAPDRRGATPRTAARRERGDGGIGAGGGGVRRARSRSEPSWWSLWWRTSLRFLLATLLAGLIPVALAGQVLGIWRLTLPGLGAPFAPAPSYTPSDLYVGADVSVLPRPGAGDPIARLGAGFPVHTVEQRAANSSTWLHVTWAGPSRASGGEGWVNEASLVSYAAHAGHVGDLGALAPSLRSAAAQRHVTAALYVPDGGRLYLSATADQPFPFGGGIRAVLLAALYATHEQPSGPADAGSPAALVANGDPAATSAVYAQLGDAAGVGAYLARLGVSGLALVPGQPGAATATPRGLLAFYSALMTTDTLSTADRASVLGLLAQSETPPLAPPSLLGGGNAGGSGGSGGVLVTGAGNAGAVWTVSGSGVLVLPQGRRAFVAAIANGGSAPAARDALSAWYGQLAPLLVG